MKKNEKMTHKNDCQSKRLSVYHCHYGDECPDSFYIIKKFRTDIHMKVFFYFLCGVKEVLCYRTHVISDRSHNQQNPLIIKG